MVSVRQIKWWSVFCLSFDSSYDQKCKSSACFLCREGRWSRITVLKLLLKYLQTACLLRNPCQLSWMGNCQLLDCRDLILWFQTTCCFWWSSYCTEAYLKYSLFTLTDRWNNITVAAVAEWDKQWIPAWILSVFFRPTPPNSAEIFYKSCHNQPLITSALSLRNTLRGGRHTCQSTYRVSKTSFCSQQGPSLLLHLC